MARGRHERNATGRIGSRILYTNFTRSMESFHHYTIRSARAGSTGYPLGSKENPFQPRPNNSRRPSPRLQPYSGPAFELMADGSPRGHTAPRLGRSICLDQSIVHYPLRGSSSMSPDADVGDAQRHGSVSFGNSSILPSSKTVVYKHIC